MSDWSSDVCSSGLDEREGRARGYNRRSERRTATPARTPSGAGGSSGSRDVRPVARDMAAPPERSPDSHRPLQLFVADGLRCFAERGWQWPSGGFGPRPAPGWVLDGMERNRIELAGDRVTGAIEFAAGD